MCFKKGIRVIEGASTMVNFYKENFSVYDFFTYQDMTGAASKVYEYCGMTLVKQDVFKSYIVAPGKTRETANSNECFGLPFVVRYGPDRLLKTKFGMELGKTNIQLFIEELGWHIEKTPGDRIYEWHNPNYTFYTYKITSTDSAKYYYGISHMKSANASIEDCLNDGYFGSGGTQFQYWYKKHEKTLRKEIMGRFNKRSQAFQDEKKLVGDLFRTDKNCLNGQPGGVVSGGSWSGFKVISVACSHHGKTAHRGGKCLRCTYEATIHEEDCKIHGRVKHQGTVCLTCKIQASLSKKSCPHHGETIFKGNSCVACTNTNNYSIKNCPTHGESTFRGKTCMSCLMLSKQEEKLCSVHGLTLHRGDSCFKCVSEKRNSIKTCDIHGDVIFSGDTCLTCNSAKLYSLAECIIHGESIHRSGTCIKCTTETAWSVQECAIHGSSKFFGNTCWSCKNEEQVKKRICDVHGESKFIGSRCYKCTNGRSVTLEVCDTHGESKHQGGKCCKCSQAKRFTLKECSVHGLVKHNGNSCFNCSNSRKSSR